MARVVRLVGSATAAGWAGLLRLALLLPRAAACSSLAAAAAAARVVLRLALLAGRWGAATSPDCSSVSSAPCFSGTAAKPCAAAAAMVALLVCLPRAAPAGAASAAAAALPLGPLRAEVRREVVVGAAAGLGSASPTCALRCCCCSSAPASAALPLPVVWLPAFDPAAAAALDDLTAVGLGTSSWLSCCSCCCLSAVAAAAFSAPFTVVRLLAPAAAAALALDGLPCAGRLPPVTAPAAAAATFPLHLRLPWSCSASLTASAPA